MISARPVEVTEMRRSRWRRAAATGLAGIAAQGLSVAVGLISIPLTVGYLGVERYGIWVVLSSVVGWLTVSDFGVVSALVNGIAVADGRKDRRYGHQLVSTAFVAMLLAATSIAACVLLLASYIPWQTVFGSSAVSTPELRTASVVAVLCFCVGFPMMTADAIYRGLQEGYKMHFWSFAGALASLVALIGVTHSKGGLPLLVFALIGVRSIIRVGNIVILFSIEHPYLRPSPRLVRFPVLIDLLRLGGFYFVQQVGAIGMFQLQPLIILKLVGASAVAQFNVAYRLYSVPQQVLYFVLSPFIAAYSESATVRDVEWIRQMAKRTETATILATIACAVALTLAAPFVISVWVGHGIGTDGPTIAWLGLYLVGMAAASPLAALAQGLGAARQLALATVLTSAVTVIAGIALVSRFGVAGMPAAMALALLLVNGPLLYRWTASKLDSVERTGQLGSFRL